MRLHSDAGVMIPSPVIMFYGAMVFRAPGSLFLRRVISNSTKNSQRLTTSRSLVVDRLRDDFLNQNVIVAHLYFDYRNQDYQ